MAIESAGVRTARPRAFETFRVIDTDVHNAPGTALLPFLSERWRNHLALVGGERGFSRATPLRLAARPNANRLDTATPSGGVGGSDPDFARQQLLDEYGMNAAIICNIQTTSGRQPLALQHDRARAINDYNGEVWLASDPRWFTSITIVHNDPEWSAREISRCHAKGPRFVQVLLDPHTERPAGDPMYWPIYQAAVECGLPVALHLHGGSRLRSGVGETTFYFEARTSLSAFAQPVVASLIFNGVFERFPDLKIVLVELQWSWAVPFAWRMDTAFELMRDEVPHLTAKPSEQFSRHFWFTSQPAFDPELPEQFDEVYGMFERYGFGNRLMFSSDYPHWDMDAPFESLPAGLAPERKRRILASNAEQLYRLDLPMDPAA